MSRVVSMRMKDGQFERLERAARQLNRSPSEAAALLLEESLRRREFLFVEFRDTPAGRTTFLQGTRIAVWHMVEWARACDGNTAQVAEHLGIPEIQVKYCLAYAAAYPDEIEAAITDNRWAADHIQELLPGIEVFHVHASAP